MKIVVSIVLLVAVAALGLWFMSGRSDMQTTQDTTGIESTGVTHTVVLGEEGYEPSDSTILLGDTVEFTTTQSDKPFWPASNLHPSHRIYSDFDPKKPIEPNQSWSFTFDQKGVWKFHDHLAPYFGGTITVE